MSLRVSTWDRRGSATIPRSASFRLVRGLRSLGRASSSAHHVVGRIPRPSHAPVSRAGCALSRRHLSRLTSCCLQALRVGHWTRHGCGPSPRRTDCQVPMACHSLQPSAHLSVKAGCEGVRRGVSPLAQVERCALRTPLDHVCLHTALHSSRSGSVPRPARRPARPSRATKHGYAEKPSASWGCRTIFDLARTTRESSLSTKWTFSPPSSAAPRHAA